MREKVYNPRVLTDGRHRRIRLPVAWEYIISDSTDAGSESFNVDFFDTYNALVLAALDAGAYVIVDLHNYARWSDGTIIGQGGPPDSNVSSLHLQIPPSLPLMDRG